MAVHERPARRSRPPDEPRDPYGHEGVEPPPETLGEALTRARQHGRAAAVEALAAVRALIDATALATSGRPSDASRLLGPLSKLLEGLGNELGAGSARGSSRLLDEIADAIDEEISLWEERARDDTEARTVLRAFLGLREILWEVGVRRTGRTFDPEPEEPARPAPAARARAASGTAGPRIQRVPVQG